MTDLKVILVPFGGSDEEINALKAAFSLAKIFHSHVRVLHISSDPKDIFSVYGTDDMAATQPLPLNIEDSLKKRYKAKRRATKAKYTKIIKKFGIEYDGNTILPNRASSSFHIGIGDANDIISTQGRLADLIIMGRAIQDVNPGYTGSIISALFDSGKPVIITPTHNLANDIDLRVVIAWNGSAQAARAVSDALPLLRRSANSTKVWVMTENDSDNFTVTSQELCMFLKQHEIDAEPIVCGDKGFTTPVAILNEAKNLNAGMIVMGAFSHSRLREMILGGATDFILKNTDIPVFMSH